jgi:rSAM/selenodomain-associated transferase 1
MSGAGGRWGILVVAKAPVAGLAKTRLAAVVGAQAAAELAATALLDTLAATAALDVPTVVAWTGDTHAAARAGEVDRALRGCTVVVPQRGADFGQRLAHAHADAALLLHGAAVVQIGTDTPQLGPALLRRCGDELVAAGTDAVLGPAADGGWWVLGVRSPRWASILSAVPMSSPDTCAATLAGLREAGARVRRLPTLRDVDTYDDARAVAAAAPGTRFARAWTDSIAAAGSAAAARVRR